MDYENYVQEIGVLFHRLLRHAPIREGLNLQGEFCLLNTLAAKGGTASPGELAEAAFLSPPRVAAILKALEKKEYLLRSPHTSDKRKTVVTITPAGEAALLRQNEESMAIFAAIIDALGEEKAMTLKSLIAETIDIVEKEAEHFPSPDSPPYFFRA